MAEESQCNLCAFENPKVCVTAVVLKDNKILVARRNEDPFKGEWDFIGGYAQKDESLEDALKREIKEELGVESDVRYISAFPGFAVYQDKEFPVVSFAYLTTLKGEIVLNEENTETAWVPLKELQTIAFDTNKKILTYLKKHFTYDMLEIKALISQLDSSAVVHELSLYEALLNGHIEMVRDDQGKLVGMGWIFPRQTLLRRQAVVEDMIVDESQRGRGLGEKILHDLLKWAKDQGVEMVELTTNPKRIAANSLYQKVGFKLHITNHYLLDLNEYKPLV